LLAKQIVLAALSNFVGNFQAKVKELVAHIQIAPPPQEIEGTSLTLHSSVEKRSNCWHV